MTYPIQEPPHLCQLFVITADGNGFSENYWIKETTAGGYQGALDVVTQAGGLAEMRWALFTASHYLAYARVSSAVRKRDTLISAWDVNTGKGTYVPTEGDTEVDEAALLIRMSNIGQLAPTFVLKPLRLIPEECVQDGIYKPTNAWKTKLDAFFSFLKDKCQIGVKMGPGDYAALDITGAAALHMSRRKVGRPFGHAAGRSRRP
jgi:hypothetical protein